MICVDRTEGVEDVEEEPHGWRNAYRRHGTSYHSFTADEVLVVRRQLLTWYEKNRRMLPWRGDPPPWTRTGTGTGTGRGRGHVSSGKRGKGEVKGDPINGSGRVRKAVDDDQTRLTAFFGKGEAKRARNMREGAEQQRTGKYPISSEGEDDDDDQRIEPSAYGTWVSEVMLQQTRVETVVDYFVKWMKLFPTPKELAEADIEQVNSAWAGLGYYRRAKMLHEGAKKVQAEYGGQLPSTAEALRNLPGVGPYTAGAVASIAFGQREPLVDGNVIRVLSRLRAIGSDPKDPALNKLCWDLAARILDPDSPGDFNQALMELGAVVCTPKSPSCSTCPVRETCRAHALTAPQGQVWRCEPPGKSENSTILLDEEETQPCPCPWPTKRSAAQSKGNGGRNDSLTAEEQNMTQGTDSGGGEQKCGCGVCKLDEDGLAVLPSAVTDFPRRAIKTAVKEHTIGVSVVQRKRKRDGETETLLVKRPATGLLAGQWECPSILLRDGLEESTATEGSDMLAAAAAAVTMDVAEQERKRRADSLLFMDLRLAPEAVLSRRNVGTVVHVFSHVRHEMKVELVRLTDDENDDSQDKDGMSSETSSKQARWVGVSDMGGLGITSGMRKVLTLARAAAHEGETRQERKGEKWHSSNRKSA